MQMQKHLGGVRWSRGFVFGREDTIACLRGRQPSSNLRQLGRMVGMLQGALSPGGLDKCFLHGQASGAGSVIARAKERPIRMCICRLADRAELHPARESIHVIMAMGFPEARNARKLRTEGKGCAVPLAGARLLWLLDPLRPRLGPHNRAEPAPG